MIGSHPVGGARGGRGGGRGHGAAPRLPAGLLVLGPRLPHHHVLRGPQPHLRRRQDAGPVRLPGHRGQARGLGGHLQLAVNSTFVFTLNWIQVGPTAEGAAPDQGGGGGGPGLVRPPLLPGHGGPLHAGELGLVES